MGPESLSNQTFSSIPYDGPADLAAGDDSQPRGACRCRRGDDREIAAVRPAAHFEHVLELAAAADPPCGRQRVGRHFVQNVRARELARMRHAEPLAALGAPALQHLTAVLGRHAHQESVRFLTVPTIRLKCAFALRHYLKPLGRISPDWRNLDTSERPRRLSIASGKSLCYRASPAPRP
jgi:hypothetical protein